MNDESVYRTALVTPGLLINNMEWKINKPYDCNSYNVVYAVICKKEKCKKAYLETQKEC